MFGARTRASRGLRRVQLLLHNVAMENPAPDRRFVERRPPARRGRLAYVATLLFTIGCGSSLSGGTGGSGGARGTGGAIFDGGSIGSGGGGAGTGGAATGGNVGSGGVATGGHVGSGGGGSIGSGGGGGSSACPKTQPSSVCCLALVDHDPLTEPYVCASTGTWVCPAGTIQEPSISGCIVTGTGGATGGSVGSGGGGGLGGRSGSGGAGGHAGRGGAGGGSAKVCGGIAGLTCSAVEFCQFGDGQCGAGDPQGVCELSGGALCLQQVVCGCDGHTYSTACAAHANGIDTMSTTSCIPGNGGTGAPCGQDTDCMTGYKCCVTGGAVGSSIACRQIPAGGSCPALP